MRPHDCSFQKRSVAAKRFLLVLMGSVGIGALGCGHSADIEAERATLAQAQADYSAAAAAKDIEHLASMYADDILILPPNGGTITGVDGGRNFLSEFAAIPGLMVSFSPVQVEVSQSGDLGYTLNTYDLTFRGPDGNPVTDRGRDFHVWRKHEDGSWKLMVDIWNSELPAGANSGQ